MELVTGFEHLARCADLTGRDIDAAARSQATCAALLERLAEVSRPESGAASLLALFAHLASPACAWLEGHLAVELFEEDEGLRVRVLEDLGNGMRERVLPSVVLRAPLAEIVSAAEDIPERLGDLRMDNVSSRCVLLLGAPEEDAPSSVFEISETCLSVPPPPVATIDDLDRGWDELAN